MSVTLSLFAGVGAQFLDNNGVILSGGLIYTYNAGTTTPIATYTSNLGNVAHSNPIVLDSAGRIPTGELWLATGFGYKFVTQDSNGVTIGTYDNVPSSAQPPITNDASSIAYEQGTKTIAGSFMVGQTYLITSIGSTNFQLIGATSNTVGLHFIATGVGTGTGTAEISRTVQSKLQDTVSVLDFGADPTGATDSTIAVNNAIASSPFVFFPPGTYLLTSLNTITGTSVNLFGTGRSTVLKFNTTGTCIFVDQTYEGSVGYNSSTIISNFSFQNIATPSSFIKLNNTVNAVIENCYFDSVTVGRCINMNQGWELKIKDCLFTNVIGDCYVQESTAGTNPSITGCDFTNNSGTAIKGITGLGELSVTDCVIEGCGAGIVANSTLGYTWNMTLSNVYFEANLGYDIDITDPTLGDISSYVTLISCSFLGTPQINLGNRGQLLVLGSANGGGNECTVIGSGLAAAFIMMSQNFIQSGAFGWTDIGGTQSFSPRPYTPTITGATISASNCKYNTIGEYITVQGMITLNATPTSDILISVPSNITDFYNTNNPPVGSAIAHQQSTGINYVGTVIVAPYSNLVKIFSAGTAGNWNASSPVVLVSGDTISFTLSYYPIYFA